jgi:hypothetical protein
MYSLSKEKLRMHGLHNPVRDVLINESERQECKTQKFLCALIEGIYILAEEKIPHTTKFETYFN